MRIIGNDPNTPRQTQRVASGTLSTGDTVVVNSDGTVSTVAESSFSETVGTAVTFESNSINWTWAVYDSANDKVVIAYKDLGNSNYGTAIVGTVSGSSISFGTSVVFESANTEYIASTFDSNSNKVVIVYRDGGNSSYGTAIVGTVSGTSISFGTPTVYASTNVSDQDIAFDSDTNKVVVCFQGSSQGRAVVGTVSGTGISFGSYTTFDSNRAANSSITYDTNAQKIVIAYKDDANNYGTAIVGTVSGTSISFGSKVVFNASNLASQSITYDPVAQKVVIAYIDYGNSSYGTAIVGTVSGTSVTFGSEAIFESAVVTRCESIYDPTSNKTVVSYADDGNGQYGTFSAGTVSGTSISFSTPVVYQTSLVNYIALAADTNAGKVVTAYHDYTNSLGKAVVYNPAYSSTNLTAENYIGTAKSGAADGDGAVINTQGNVATIPATFFDIENAFYDNVEFNTSTQTTSPRTCTFKTDGTKMYVAANNGSIYQYALSTAWDLSTVSYESKSFDPSTQDSDPKDVKFKSDGSKMYILGDQNDLVFQYSLSTSWDVSTASYDSVSFSASSQTTGGFGIVFKPDGTSMFYIGSPDVIYQYTLSSAWDLSTASYANKSHSVTDDDDSAGGFTFNSDGTKLYYVGYENDLVHQYSLTTAYDISTASSDGVTFSVNSQTTVPTDIAFSSDGDKMYICGFSAKRIYQYSTSVALTPAQSYYVQTDGTITTTAGDPSVFAGTAISSTKLIVKG